MKLNLQKKLAADVSKCSKKRIKFDVTRLEDIKGAITKLDIRTLIAEGVIKKKPSNASSRVRARKIAEQKRKGRRKGLGKRKGKKTARLSKKESWMNNIRTQRRFLKELKDKNIIKSMVYRQLYMKSKGGFFRSKRHIKLYIEEHKLATKK